MATFRTRARALDMLGRQQIAGRPTAISELFKNAHDAYADRVEVDYYRSDGLFVLRDDGLGMTKEDFERRWLTLGTESKLGSGIGLPPPPVDHSKPLRQTLGEKGIGRLAIAVIGPQVLILTRAKRNEQLGDLVVAFIHWGVFEAAGLDMEQIDFPVVTFPGGSLPTGSDVQALVDVVRQNVTDLADFFQPEQLKNIISDLDSFNIDPVEIDNYLKSPSLRGHGHGTHFYILPTDESLSADIDDQKDDYTAAPLTRMLIGFTNTMTPDHGPVLLKTAFRDHKTDDDCEDLIEDRVFFTPEEFHNADHHIEGTFDDYGQFVGTVSVYRGDAVKHVVPWTKARGHRTECGPFKINFAYVQGAARESKLPPEEWGAITAKLNLLGGLYIYRDGIRVLPYGNTDFDFLDIERNRTKSASYYYFSYRRMFGVIELTHQQNGALSEKAGREGFRENKAYRQFRDILRDFFVQMAADFFREGGPQADRFLETRAELQRNEMIRREHEKQASVKKRKLREALDATFDKLEARNPENDACELLEWLAHELTKASAMSNPDRAAQAFIDGESGAMRKLQALREAYKITKPQGVGLSKPLMRDWNAYRSEYQRLEVEVFGPTRQRIEELVGEQAHLARVAIDLRKRVERGIQDQIDRLQRATNSDAKETQQIVENVRLRVIQLTKASIAEVDAEMNLVSSELSRTDFSEMDEQSIVERRASLEERIIAIVERKRGLLEVVRGQLQEISLVPDADDQIVGTVQKLEAVDEERMALREKVDSDLELTQLGMAIGIIDHEFRGTVRSVRSNLRRLKAWAEVNDGLNELYTNIRASFDHLDSYLALFTPLHRRLYRKATAIKGVEIADFLKDLFNERMQRHSIEFKPTQEFLSAQVTGYPSTFYPVFVNLVDNAVFWLKDRSEPRIIHLDADGQSLIVSDNGPGIPTRDREAVFEHGFTRKPGGQGIGLYVSKETLERVGYRLVLGDQSHGQGAAFIIQPNNENHLVEEEHERDDI